MRLFRSEEEIEDWCRSIGRTPGAKLPVDLLARLAARWYGDRLDPDWSPRSPEDSQRILDELGLTGEFWRLR